ncbi:FAD/NAD-P-binding domain-containing protein [Mycena sp. CBHHK59/15]|nr:FAD/NAD-P-binding domain-containing protein [Mycena sp. CBHHK59/15]
MSQTDYKFRVAIVGCGIGGLALAAFIGRFAKENPKGRIAVDIYEAKPEVSTIGNGVAIWKRSWQALQDLGFEEDIVKKGFKVPKDGESRGPIFRNSGQPTEGYDFHDHMMPYGPRGLHRPTLLDILQSKLSADCKIHTSKRLGRYDVAEGGSINLSFSDGSVATADILVGADGVHSATRESMFKSFGDGYEQYIRPAFSGRIAYRGVIPKFKLAEAFPDHPALDHPKVWCGKNMHVVSHPIGPNVGMNCFYSQPDMEGKPYVGPLVTDVATEDVSRLFVDWEPYVLQLIQYVESYTAWAIHVVNPLPCYVSGSVVLIGDAAHAMTPHQGVGGGQAIEDAHILGRLLAHPLVVKPKIPATLKLHEKLRLSRTQDAGEKSRINGMMYEFNHPNFLFNDPTHPDGPSREELEALGNAVGLSFAWLADGNVEEDWAEAEAQLKAIAEKPE